MSQTIDARSLGFIPERLERLNAYIQSRYIDSGKLPCAGLLIGRGDEVAHLWTSGVAEDAIFRIASMTKPVTSIALMQLVEAGRVALADPVAKHLPEFADTGVFVSGGGHTPFVTRPPATPMRVVDLMRHTSGLTYSFQERSNVDAAYRKLGFERFDGGSMADYVAKVASLPLEFDPGTAWNYSVSTDIVGAIVERVSGETLSDYFAGNIFAPLGMVDTHFRLPMEKIDRVPDCHVWDPKVRMKMFDAGATTAWAKPHGYYSGGGGLVSTLSDYHRFCRMLLNQGELDGARIVSPHTIRLMTANHLPGGGDLTRHSKSLFSEADNAGMGFGLGFGTVIDSAATLLPGNTGEFYWGGMYSTAFLVDPVDDVIMIFMTQLMPSSSYPVRREIKTMLYAAMTD